MALQVETIPFTLRTGIGVQTIPHVLYPSSAAKAVVFICGGNTGTNSEIFGVGFDDGTNRCGNGIGIADSFGTRSARGYGASYSLITTQAQAFFGGYARMLSGYISTINVGSFDITLDVNNTSGAQWYAVVISGSAVECAVGNYNVLLGSGTVNVGFDVAALLTLGVTSGNGDNVGADQSRGFATQCSDQAGWGSVFNPTTSSATYQIDGVIQADITSSAGGPTDTVLIPSWTATGFDLTVSGTPAWNIGYLAIGGDDVSANLVPILQPASTGVQNTTIDATSPVAVFFGSTCKAASASPSVSTNHMIGVYDGVSQLSQWWGSVNASSSRDRLGSTTKSITMATPTGVSTSTVNSTASCALAATNIALNWTTVDGTAREVWALVLAQNLTGSSNPCGENPQGSITVFKQTSPTPSAVEFPFGTTGGLSPTTFSLTNGESQLFSGLSPGTYGVTETTPTGWTAAYTVSNSDPHDAIVIAGTEAVTVTVLNTLESTSHNMRRLRRWQLPYDGNKKIFIPRIEIIAKMGVGNADDADPVMSLRISPDGGVTWGPYREMPFGAAGETMVRAYLTRFCQGLRNPVAELHTDAPVFVAWVQCVLPQDFTVGTS